MPAEKVNFNVYTALKEWNEDPRIDAQHYRILGCIEAAMNKQHWNGAVSMSVSTVCRKCKISKPTFLKKRKELVEMGWLEYTKGTVKTIAAKYIVRDLLIKDQYQEDTKPLVKTDTKPGKNGYQALVKKDTKEGPELGIGFYPYIRNKEERIKEGGVAASVDPNVSVEENPTTAFTTLIQEDVVAPVKETKPFNPIESLTKLNLDDMISPPESLVSRKEQKPKRDKKILKYTPPSDIATPLTVFLEYSGFKKSWQDFKAMYEKKRGRMTEAAKDLLFRDLVKWAASPQTAVSILEYSIKGGYPQLYEPKTNSKKATSVLSKDNLGNLDYKELKW